VGHHPHTFLDRQSNRSHSRSGRMQPTLASHPATAVPTLSEVSTADFGVFRSVWPETAPPLGSISHERVFSCATRSPRATSPAGLQSDSHSTSPPATHGIVRAASELEAELLDAVADLVSVEAEQAGSPRLVAACPGVQLQPAGARVLVSIPSPSETKAMPSTASSSRSRIRCRKLRPSRSR
jgi:hypothetical protein